jgi:hypothetical protein
MAEIIAALNGLAWPGAIAFSALCAATVGVAFAFADWLKSV